MIPKTFKHIPAPGMPEHTPSDKIRNHAEGLRIQREYQESWEEWKIRDDKNEAMD